MESIQQLKLFLREFVKNKKCTHTRFFYKGKSWELVKNSDRFSFEENLSSKTKISNYYALNQYSNSKNVAVLTVHEVKRIHVFMGAMKEVEDANAAIKLMNM